MSLASLIRVAYEGGCIWDFSLNTLLDPTAYPGNHGGHLKHVWVDNSSSLNRSLQLQHVLDNKNIDLCCLLACSTSLAQHVD